MVWRLVALATLPLASLALLASCGSTGDRAAIDAAPSTDATLPLDAAPPPDAALETGPIAFEDFALAMMRVRCETFVECGLYPDIDTCVTGRPLSYEAFSHVTNPESKLQVELAVAAGITEYDPEQARVCVDALRDGSCGRSASLFPREFECLTVFRGTKQLDQECVIDQECDEGLECRNIISFPNCLPGTCQPKAPGGVREFCHDRQCEPGLTCTNQLICLGGFELEQLMCPEPGDPCPRGHQCDPSSDTCVPYAGTGEACIFGGCEQIDDHCSFDGICEPTKKIGEACEGFNSCDGYAACYREVCVPRAAYGEQCSRFLGGLPGCQLGSDCSQDLGTCSFFHVFSCPYDDL